MKSKARTRTGALPRWQRLAVRWFAFASWATGGVWLIYRYFVRTTDDFGFDVPHPWQRGWVIAHAFASLVALWLFGLLWHHHIARGWESRLRRGTGGTLFGIAAWLAISGCALYYIGQDAPRNAVSLAHWIVGLSALAAYLWHDRRA